MVYAKIIDNSKVLKTVSNISYESVLSFILVVNNQHHIEYTEYQCRNKEIIEITFKDIKKNCKITQMKYFSLSNHRTRRWFAEMSSRHYH